MNLIVKSFINIINNPKANSVDRYIASQMIENSFVINQMSITELADFIKVSYSQMSRFVRHIGFDSYGDFKESLLYHGNVHRHLDVQIKQPISYSNLQNNIIEETKYFLSILIYHSYYH